MIFSVMLLMTKIVWWLCLMSKIHTMEAMAPAPAQQAHRVLRFLAVSWAPMQHRPFSPTKQQVKLRSPLQSSVQICLFMYGGVVTLH